MQLITEGLIVLIALLHLLFFWVESVAWKTVGRNIFGGKKEFFEQTQGLATNQGLYNGFLAAGLLWSLALEDQAFADMIARFFLICVLLAGVLGGMTISRRIFWVQGFPALLALLFYLLR